MMNIGALATTFAIGKEAISAMKALQKLFPNSKEKEAATKLLDQAEKSFKIAETEAAKELGYMLCRCTWPPQIMVDKGGRNKWQCSKCGSISDTSPGMEIISAGSDFKRQLDHY